MTTISTKLRSFQTKLLLNAVLLNPRLCVMGIKESDMCEFCKQERESLTHLFVNCRKVKPLWETVKTWIKKPTQFKTTDRSVLFNETVPNPRHVENTIALIAKYYIYSTKCRGKDLQIGMLKNKIKQYRQIEYEIAKHKEKLDKHEQKWTNVTL